VVARLRTLGARLERAPPRLKAAPKVVEPFYQSKAWKQLVARRRLDGDYFAALRRRKDAGERLILDHVRERKDGGDDLDPSNTQWLTMSEHQAKTARERSARAAGHR
jgi:hypothetical protein